MLSKTRTKIFTLVATAALATAGVAPAVSQAKPKGPKTISKAALCEALRITQELWRDAAESAREKGELDRAVEDEKQEEKAEGEAGNAGCLWSIEIEAVKNIGKVAAGQPSAAVRVIATK